LLFARFDETSHSFISAHTIRPNGKDEVDVPMPGPEGGGDWSTSGEHIAVMTELEDHRIGTAIITADGKLERELDIPDDSLNLVCTVWSPDDSRLACEGWDDGDESRHGMYTVRASDGGDLVRLTKPPKDEFDLPGDFSADGATVLFKRAPDETDGPLMTVDVKGGQPKVLGKEFVEDSGDFSPDGKTILTSASGRLLLLDDTGKVRDVIKEDGAFLFGAVWSPDGSRIAYSRAVGGPHADIYTSRPDGSDRRKVTSTPDNEISVQWGPK
jgi:Tol biopolymer transport system component